MEDRERLLRKIRLDYPAMAMGGFGEDIDYLLTLIDSLRASQKELVDSGKDFLSNSTWTEDYGWSRIVKASEDEYQALKQAIEKIKES